MAMFYSLDVGGSPLIAEREYIIETIRTEMQEMDIGQSFTITAVDMTQEQVDSLPEWDGP